MSNRILTFEYRPFGVLTDLSSVPLMSDPTGYFGIKEVVSGTIVSINDTPMIRMSVGTYQLSLIGLNTVNHLAWFEWIVAGGCRRVSYSFTPEIISGAIAVGSLVSMTRARLCSDLAGLSVEALNALILAASAAINKKYTIPETVPEEVQEACVQLMAYFKTGIGVASERLGDWAMSRASNATFPDMVTLLLAEYKTPRTPPRVVKEEVSECTIDNF
jgi:hypothetical protein